ncbi:MAG: S41 family peptidase [Clostridia bacterium]|jgi:carboxyl-terminal processing protease|nr:S41 family peptidase [Clostridia bacterium]
MRENKKQKIYRVVMLILVVSLITFIVTTVLMYNDSIKYVVSTKGLSGTNQATKKLDMLFATITELLDEKYIGDVNQEDLIDGALKELVNSVGDVYTTYYTKEELEDFNAETMGKFVGIGVYMRASLETGKVEVTKPIKGSPAEEAGIKTGDQILKVDGVEYVGDDLDEVAKNIKGEEGTEVTLTIKRGEEVFDLKIVRKNVHMNYVSGEMLDNNIGYMYIERFDEDCIKDFKSAYNELVAQEAKSLILDLRSNGGGLVDEALEIADMMCEKNEIMLITIDKDGKEVSEKAKKDREIKMPIVVLTNGGTASAAEILVGALKDNEKAVIVGDKTFGKGVIQELIYLSNGGALKVTSSEYYTPKKNKINKLGIEPDYQVSFDFKNLEVDEQLNKAIEIIKEKMN